MRFKSLILGVGALAVPLFLVFLSIAFSPWFRWEANALSDLGHSLKSPVAPLFNVGLVTGGLLMILYSVLYMIRKYPHTSKLMAASGYFLMLVGTFDEVYGGLHFLVSLFFFLGIAIAAIIYSYEGRKNYPVISTVVIAVSWALQLSGACPCGEAVPEMISILVTLPWYLDSLRNVERSLKW